METEGRIALLDFVDGLLDKANESKTPDPRHAVVQTLPGELEKMMQTDERAAQWLSQALVDLGGAESAVDEAIRRRQDAIWNQDEKFFRDRIPH